MPKSGFVVILLALSLLAAPYTHVLAAQDDELPNVMVNPDHPLYWFKRTLYEPLILVFAFNPESKAETHLTLASDRLAELRNMIEKGRSDFVDDLVNDHGNHIDDAMRDADRVEDRQTKATVWEHVANVTAKHLAVLKAVLARAPQAAHKGLMNAIQKSQHGHDIAVARLQGLPKPNKCPPQNPHCNP